MGTQRPILQVRTLTTFTRHPVFHSQRPHSISSCPSNRWLENGVTLVQSKRTSQEPFLSASLSDSLLVEKLLLGLKQEKGGKIEKENVVDKTRWVVVYDYDYDREFRILDLHQLITRSEDVKWPHPVETRKFEIDTIMGKRLLKGRIRWAFHVPAETEHANMQESALSNIHLLCLE